MFKLKAHKSRLMGFLGLVLEDSRGTLLLLLLLLLWWRDNNVDRWWWWLCSKFLFILWLRIVSLWFLSLLLRIRPHFDCR